MYTMLEGVVATPRQFLAFGMNGFGNVCVHDVGAFNIGCHAIFVYTP